MIGDEEKTSTEFDRMMVEGEALRKHLINNVNKDHQTF